MKTYRASEAPLAMECPASVNAPEDEIRIESSNPAGLIGTVVHKICERLVQTGEIPEDWQSIAAGYHDFNLNEYQEIGQLIYAAKAFWDEYGPGFYTPRTEVYLESDILSGHIDAVSYQDIPILLDWKTTRLDIDYTAQMQFYAWLWLLNWEDTLAVKTDVVFLRDRTHNTKTWDYEQIRAFGDAYTSQVINWDGRTYRSGGHCAYCPRWSTCQAQGMLVGKTSLELRDNERLPREPDDLIDLYERIGVVEKRIKEFKDAVRARAYHEAGIKGTDKRLELVSQKRDTIDARKAWGIMDAFLTDDEIASCISVKKGELLRTIGDTKLMRPPGVSKAEVKRHFMEKLHEAGAVTTTEFTTLRLKQSKTKEVEIAE